MSNEAAREILYRYFANAPRPNQLQFEHDLVFVFGFDQQSVSPLCTDSIFNTNTSVVTRSNEHSQDRASVLDTICGESEPNEILNESFVKYPKLSDLKMPHQTSSKAPGEVMISFCEQKLITNCSSEQVLISTLTDSLMIDLNRDGRLAKVDIAYLCRPLGSETLIPPMLLNNY